MAIKRPEYHHRWAWRMWYESQDEEVEKKKLELAYKAIEILCERFWIELSEDDLVSNDK